jgi:hypothetical protein
MIESSITIGDLVEHIVDGESGEVIGCTYDPDGEIELLSVWLDSGEVVDDYFEFWDKIDLGPLPDNVIHAADRFREKK